MINTTDAAYNLSRIFQVYLSYLNMTPARRQKIGCFDRYLDFHLAVGAGDQLVTRGSFYYTVTQPLNFLRSTLQRGVDPDERRRELVLESVRAFDSSLRTLERQRYRDQVQKLKQLVGGDRPEKEFDQVWKNLRLELRIFSKDLPTLRRDIRSKGEMFHRQLIDQNLLDNQEDINDLEVLFRLISHVAEQETNTDTLHSLHQELVEVLMARGMGMRGQEESQTLFAAGDLLGDLAEIFAAGIRDRLQLPPSQEMAEEMTWGLSESSFLSLMLAISRHAQNLREVVIHGRSFENKLGDSAMSALADVLRYHPKIQVLDLRYNQISGEGMSHLQRGISKSFRLEALILRGNPLGNRGGSYLAGAIKHLELLTLFDVARCQIGNEGANSLGDALSHLPLLDHVNFRRNRIEESGCIGIADIIAGNRVDSLRLGRNSIGDLGAQTLAAALEHNHQLKSLDLQHCDISNQGVRALEEAVERRGKRLKLDLEGNQIEVSPEQSKKEIQQLRHDLASLTEDPDEEREIHQLMEAIEGVIQAQPEKASKVRLLLVQTLQQILAQLRLRRESGDKAPNLAPKMLYQTYVDHHPNPTIRAVLGEGAAPDSPREFTDNLELLLRNQQLYLGNSGISLIAPLMKKGIVLRLYLRDQGLGPEGARQLAIGVLAARALADLRLEDNPIGDVGLSALGTALVSNSSLRRLHLKNCGMGKEGIDGFASGLAVNRGLRRLEIEEEGLSDEAVAQIFRAARASPSLKHLQLTSVRVGAKATVALKDLLADNKTLEVLTLSGVTLGPEEAKAIANGLKENRSLKELHLIACGLEDNEALAVDKVLRTHPHLKLLDLSNNAISMEGQGLILVGSGNRYFKTF